MEDARKKVVFQLILYRLLISTVLIVAAISIQFGTTTFLPLNHFYLIIASIYIVSCVFFLIYHWSRNYTLQIYIQLIFDLVWITALVYIFGGLEGNFNFLYILEIVVASVILSSRAAYLTAAASCIFFGSLVDLMYFEVIPYYGGMSRSEVSTGVFINNIFVAWGAFFLIAFLVNYLTKKLRKTANELEHAKRELEIKKNLAIAGDVAAHLAHEIRNPLTAISGSVQVLSKNLDLSGEQKNLMRIIIKESKRVSESFEQFLTLASPGKSVFSTFRFSSLVKDTVILLRGSNELPSNIELIGNYHKSNISFYGSRNQFKQIFWNIIKNSIKAMKNGGKLEINFNLVSKQKILLQFKDTGLGMNEDEQKKIFEPFQSGFEKGQGIGMSVVRRIVNDYNGSIYVDSQTDIGTDISIILPRNIKH